MITMESSLLGDMAELRLGCLSDIKSEFYVSKLAF